MPAQPTLFSLPAPEIAPGAILQSTSQITDAHIEAFAKTLSWCTKSTVTKYIYSLKILRGLNAPLDARVLCLYDAFRSEKQITTREGEIAGIKRFLWFGATAGWLPVISIDHARELLRNQRGSQRFNYIPKVPDMAACRAVVDYWLNLPTPGENSIEYHPHPRFYVLRNRAILLALISTGARIGEVMSLRTMQFASDEDSAWICGKRKLWRYIFFAPAARAAIQEYIVERNRCFPDVADDLWISEYHGEKLGNDAVNTVIKKALRALGLPDTTVTCHSYRHYVATEMLHLGFSMHQIQRYLGHTTTATTSKVYAHVLDEDRRRAVQSYHNMAAQFNKRRKPSQPPPPPQHPPVLPPAPPPLPGSYMYLPAHWESSVSALTG